MKIFICEQDPSKAKSMEAILGVYSYKVVTVQKYTDLFKQAVQQKPAVIILNENFTDNFGLDILSRLKTDPATSKIPVIYIGDKKGAYTNESCIEFVQEPIKIKNLRHFVDRWTTFRSLYVRH